MKLVVVYLASPRDWGWLKWSRLDCLSASLKLLQRFAPEPLPVIVFHEDYTSEDMARLRAVYPKITFEQVDFSTHQHRYEGNKRGSRTGSYGYGMMCRFFCGPMQSHPSLQGYSHYMRLDDDSYLLSPLDAGVMGRIQSFDYTYRCTFEDPHESLWQHTLEFLRDHQIPIPAGARYSGTAPYTNYHTCNLAVWRHPVMVEFMASVEARDGCLNLGWDDAVIAEVMVKLLLPAMGCSTHMETGFCYRHNQHCSHRGGHGHGPLCKDGNEAHHGGNPSYQWGPPFNLC